MGLCSAVIAVYSVPEIKFTITQEEYEAFICATLQKFV